MPVQIKRDDADKLVLELQAMQTRAAACGLHVTRRALNRAMNAAGWEIAGNIEMAGKSMQDDNLFR